MVDAWVAEYNADRPHQALDEQRPVTPADRFTPTPDQEKKLLPVWLPPVLVAAPHVSAGQVTSADDNGTSELAEDSPCLLYTSPSPRDRS